MKRLQSINPATMEVSGEVDVTDPSEVEGIVQDTRKVQGIWGSTPRSERIACLKRLRRKLIDEADRIVLAVHSDTGKPKGECYSTEVFSSVTMAAYCEDLLKRFRFEQKVDQGPMSLMCGFMGRRSYIEYKPHGVIGVISPYNFPFAIPFTEIVMAVAAGNAVILKPSSDTPLSGHLIQQLFEESGFPKGLVVAVSGPGVGSALTASSVDKIVFTGGSDTGVQVMKDCADRLIPVVLELGGKDAMIVMDDADIERSTECAVWASFVNSGQVCVSVKRIYVQRSVYGTFLEKFAGRASSLRQGNGWEDEEVSVGPMINMRELKRMESVCAEIVQQGGRIVIGGKRNPSLKGCFFEPTIVADLPCDAEIVDREIFGPIVCVFPFDTEEEAVRMANDCSFALAGSVWTKDLAKGRRIASKLLSGTIDVNNAVYTYGLPATPWGGCRMSGIGTTHAEEGFRQMMRPHHVHVDKGRHRRDPWWMPYNKDDSSLLRDIVGAFFGGKGRTVSAVRRFMKSRDRV